MLTNRRLSAAEALAWGIVNQVVPDAELAGAGAALAATLAAGATRAFGTTKRLLLASAAGQDLEPQMAAETKGIVGMTSTADAREGIAAFLAKRRPTFTGR
jgi:2-(1,2-epoxy-1,2-dihydrophenyl)acetyl-CoA isomerase